MSVWGELRKKSSGEKISREDSYLFSDKISPEELRKMLRQGIVRFKYRKKALKGKPVDSGKVRIAWGTTKSDIITKIPHSGESPAKGSGYSNYFDVEKADWRCYFDGFILGVCPKIFTQEDFDEMYPILKDEEN